MASVISTQHSILPPAWRALKYFSLYRITLAGLFVAMAWAGHTPGPLESGPNQEFLFWASCYLAMALVLQFVFETLGVAYFEQVVCHMVADSILLTLLMGASGGAASGLGMLIGISIVWGSFLTDGRGAVPFAALASLLVLAQQGHGWMRGEQPGHDFTHAGLLGGVLFAIALLSHALARRIGASLALAEQRGVDLASLARLNDFIVQRMRSGVLVLSPAGRIELANRSAEALLGVEQLAGQRKIEWLLPELVKPLALWRRDASQSTHLVRPASRSTDLLVTLTELEAGRGGAVLMFLEDAAAMRQRAQQLKLASLGRLTASIAHEVRNPLGAISHASQLLREVPNVNIETACLIRIILEHSQRVNGVIESVLGLGRRESPILQSFALLPWLEQFASELRERFALVPGQVLVHGEPALIEVQMDPGQLRQVLWNLSENALRYSRGTPALELRAGVKSLSDCPYLDVIDHGSGIPKDIEDRVFEPFVSKNSTGGTGLGLFIASELCEANQASLSLQANSDNGCCFRIRFAHPKRKQWVLQ
jgi:two-component system, NtrC family, sensor histidine kinase PilS